MIDIFHAKLGGILIASKYFMSISERVNHYITVL